MTAVSTILDKTFCERPVLEVAPDLLGKVLMTPKLSGIITEVEAYDGPEDKACHGRFGPTQRTKAMFGPAGHFYVYLCYGVHWMLNVVTGEQGYPAAVLVRGVREPTSPTLRRSSMGKGIRDGSDSMLDGPGKLTKAFGINGSFNGKPVDPTSGLWIEDRGVSTGYIETTPRIGVDYAEEWKEKLYRFVLSDEQRP